MALNRERREGKSKRKFRKRSITHTGTRNIRELGKNLMTIGDVRSG